MAGIGDLTTFGDDGAEVEAEAPDGAEQEAPAGEEQTAAKEPHSRTRTHDDKGKFAGPAPKPPEKKEPAPPARLKLRVPKDDGSGEEELELTPEEAGQRLGEARRLAAQREKERAEASQHAKEAKAFSDFKRAIREGDNRAQAMRRFARDSGMSQEECEDFFAEVLHGELQESQLTPEQRRIRELEEREAQREEEERANKANAEVERFTQDTRAREAEYTKLWGEALEKTGLPKTPALLADIAKHHIINKKQGLSLTADELATYASREFDKSVGARLKDLPPEELGKRFPEVEKAWSERLDKTPPVEFLKKHPNLGRELLKHFRGMARSKTQPGVGAPRPPERPAPRPKVDEAPRRYDPWNPLGN